MPLWLIHLLAAATALALAEHWLRYALVERERQRRAAARLERIRRGRERREDAERDQRLAQIRAHALSPEGRAAWAAHTTASQREALGLASYAEQMRAMQGVGVLGSQAAQHMAMGLNPAAQSVQGCRDPAANRTQRLDPTAECRCIFCQRATGRYETGTGPFP